MASRIATVEEIDQEVVSINSTSEEVWQDWIHWKQKVSHSFPLIQLPKKFGKLQEFRESIGMPEVSINSTSEEVWQTAALTQVNTVTSVFPLIQLPKKFGKPSC